MKANVYLVKIRLMSVFNAKEILLIEINILVVLVGMVFMRQKMENVNLVIITALLAKEHPTCVWLADLELVELCNLLFVVALLENMKLLTIITVKIALSNAKRIMEILVEDFWNQFNSPKKNKESWIITVRINFVKVARKVAPKYVKLVCQVKTLLWFLLSVNAWKDITMMNINLVLVLNAKLKIAWNVKMTWNVIFAWKVLNTTSF